MVAPRVVLLAGVAGATLLAVGLLWHYLLAAGVLYAAVRHLTRHTRRRRPKSSWSSLGRTVALMFAAWNSRWLKPAAPASSSSSPDPGYCPRCGAHVVGTPCYLPPSGGDDTIPY